jgi:hypothetical protein
MPAGRKTKYTPETVTKIVNALSVGAYQKDACAVAGISDDTFANWCKRYSDFSDRVSRARAEGWIADLAVIRRAAIDGDWRAAGDHLDRTGAPYRKAADTQINLTIDVRRIAERVASEYGLDPADVIAEAESIISGSR